MTVSVKRIRVSGPVAEDKDGAREMRTRQLLPALNRGESVVIDFSKVTTSTQSYVHAFISEAVRTYGEEVLETIEFRGCTDEIQQLVSTVIEYSLRARTLSQEGLSGTLKKADVPQADNLELVREVLDALGFGRATPEDVVATTGFSLRHVHYRLHSARVLGFVRMGRNIASLTEQGRKLIRTDVGSIEERDLLIAGIKQSGVLQKLCPSLLDRRPPRRAELARRIGQKTGLSPSTASRRAQALLAWRRQLISVQQELPGLDPKRRATRGGKPAR
jgi:hypothetical protein